jgi:excisionase family DNA binding protein
MTAPLLTVAEAAKILAISTSTLRGLVAARRIASRKIGGSIRFAQEDIDEFLERCKRPIRESRQAPKQYPHLRPMKTFV